ncbi:hypothetical protein AURDEDRAFT_182766 [Auricularia subglabra TFB-10046 SS5]|nr:hypothetical protein AURDEDRAFT_182766 [Auricularia subglabra TFB-10046 SS5]
MRTVALAAVAALAATAHASSWPYTRTYENATTPDDERDDQIPNLFLDWLKGALENDDSGELAGSFKHGHIPKHVADFEHLERHALYNHVNKSELPETIWDRLPTDVELDAAAEAQALFGHLGFELDPECISKRELYWYRTPDGRCNWLKRGESLIGSTGQPRSRDFDQTTFADGISAPREGPNPREVSNAFFKRKERLHYDHTPLMLGLVEFLMHDVSYSADSETEFIEVPIPKGDPAYDPYNHGNASFKVWRSLPFPGSGSSKQNPRQHVNGATAWLDCSALYGSTAEVADALRSHTDGKLKAQRGKDGYEYLPFNDQGLPVRTRPGVNPRDLFLGGDVRTNEDYIMLSVHTLLLREHNRLCDILVAQHPDWDDERVYQTIKLVMGAKIALIGNGYQMAYWAENMPWPRDDGFPLYRAMYGESVVSINPFHSYPWPMVTRNDRPMVTSAEMSIVYRFHEFIINKFPIKDAHNNTIEEREIFDTAFDAKGFLGLGADPILRGMLASDIPNFKSGVDETFRSAGRYRGSPFDIVTWSIVHEREQGLPTFNQYFTEGYAKLEPTPDVIVKQRKTFEEFSSDPQVVADLKRLYKTPDDVDFVVGVQLEEELFPGTTMPVSALIPSLFSLFGVGNSDRFCPGYAMMRCFLVDKPWNCHPSNALEDLLWEPRPTEDYPHKRWVSEFWATELDFPAHGVNLLWRLITENSGAKCIQKNPLFPFDPEKNPVLCELPEPESNTTFYATYGSAAIAILSSIGFWFYHRKQRRLRPGVLAPKTNGGYWFFGVCSALKARPAKFVLQQYESFGRKTFGLRLFGSLVYYVCSTPDDIDVMANDEERASLVELSRDRHLGSVIWRHAFKQHLFATVIRRRLETAAGETLPPLAKVVQEVVEDWLKENENVLKRKIDDFRPHALQLSARILTRVIFGRKRDVSKNHKLLNAFIGLANDPDQFIGVWTLVKRWYARVLLRFNCGYRGAIRKRILPLISARRTEYVEGKSDMNSLLDAFLDAASEDNDVAQLIEGIVIGSLTNLADTLTNALYNVAEVDGLQNKVRAGQDVARIVPRAPSSSSWNLLRSVTLETLRLAGAVLGPARKVAVKDFKIASVTVKDPKLGTKTTLQTPLDSVLVASPLITHYDKHNYDKAHEFIPDRFTGKDAPIGTSKYLSFGLPPHTCPGRFFAIEAVSIALNALVSRYEVHLVGQAGRERYKYTVGSVVMPRVPLKMTLTPLEPAPFNVHISDDELARLRRKLQDCELPATDIVPDAGWNYGVSLEWVKGLRQTWLDDFNWRDVEQELNRQFKVDIEDVNIHFVHQRSQQEDAIPLVLVHGWPGTFFEFYALIDSLVNPPDGEIPFHVVVPSVPGFLFSSTPQKTGWTVVDTARILDTLMTNVLGYANYVVQGGDWGSLIATLMSDSSHCKAVHLNMCTVPPPHSPLLMGLVWALPTWLSSKIVSWMFTPDEWRQLLRTKDFAMQGAGYFATQSTQPLTIGLALNDSPIGLLIWIGEKYHTHVDPAHQLSDKSLLTIISLYYFTQSFASSCLPYRENTALFGAPPAKIGDCVLGVSVFDHDILILPRYWIERWHRGKLVFYRKHERGGHFPALDNPLALVEDLREMVAGQLAVFVIGEK